MVSIAIQNKRRGRAFQTKLAEMSGGMNIGTLGGEDVNHPEFSYEAKTYKKDTKTNKGKNWLGEELLTFFEWEDFKKDALVIIVTDQYKMKRAILRWYWWERLNTMKDRGGVDLQLATLLVHEYDVTRFTQGKNYLEQAEKNCPDGKLPLVVVHTVGKRHDSDVVLLYYEYWKSFMEIIVDKYF